MFKKPFPINQTHKVSGADRKKIRKALYKSLQLSNEEQLDQLLPAKAGELELAKLPAPSRLVIYLLDGLPVLLDTSGKSDFIPTAMGLWSCPQMLPQVQLKHPAVSQFLLGGADLMLPGVDLPSLPDFSHGQLLSIVVPGNPAPIAVGLAVMSSSTAQGQAQGKGKLVEVLQHYGDCLWQSLAGKAVPNEGFMQGVVLPTDPSAAAVDSNYVVEQPSAGADAEAGQPDPAAALECLSLEVQQTAQAEGRVRHQGGDTAAAAAAVAASASAEQPSSSGRSSSAWPDDMDQLLELALLQALTKSVKEDELPLISSTLWSQHIKPCAPPGAAPLDVKKSSHKKMDKFLQVYSKCGLLSTREDKFSGNTVITGINRSHQLLEEYRPYKMSSSSSSAGSAPGAAQPSASGMAPAAAAGVSGPVAPLVVEEVYKPSKDVKAIFEAVGAAPDGLYTAAAAADVAFQYAKQEQLDTMAPDNKTLVLDAQLCDALYKGLIKKGELYPTHIAKAELREAFLKRLQPQTCISRGDQHLLRKGAMPTVQISGERRQGNKYVTHIVGVEAFLVDPTQLAAECQKKYACSTSVNALPGKTNSGQEVILQGNVIEKVPDYLMAHYGIPKKYFLVKK